jgi:hypothetical protein
MRWYNSAWALLQYIEFVREQKEIITGRGIKLKREKASIFQRRKRPAYEENSSESDCSGYDG